MNMTILLYIHCVSKNYTDVAHYNFNEHQLILVIFARDVIYTSRAYATMSVSVFCPSVCDASALGRCAWLEEGRDNLALLATARPSCGNF